MTNIGTGHLIFAGVFVLAFIIFMVISYRKDLAKTRVHYRRIWAILILAVVVYFTIFFLNKYT